MNATNLRNSIVLYQSGINLEIKKSVSELCLTALSCNEMLEGSGNETFIQLDKSIFDKELKEYIDGFSTDKHGRLFFSTSTEDFIYTREIWDLEVETLFSLLAQLEKMADERNN